MANEGAPSSTPDAILTALGQRADELSDPAELLALATEIDELASQMAHAITRDGADPAAIAPLKLVLLRVPDVRGRTLLRAAQRFDDRGSPRRAALVLIEALHRAFGSELTSAISDALRFTLEAHGHPAAADRVRVLVAPPDPPAADRRQARAAFVAGLDALRESIDWNALEDEAIAD